MAKFTKQVFPKFYYQPIKDLTRNFEPSRTAQTGNGKGSSIVVHTLQDVQL